MIDPRLKDLVLNGTPAQRKYICDRDFVYFAIYYFPEFFHYQMADFHWDMHDDLRKLTDGELAFIVWMMFRESAKTTIAKMYACYLGAFKKKRYVNFDSYEKENAEAALFDIALWFQTNPRLIADFGQLYWEKPKQKKSTMKRISNFVLSNGVKYEAFSTQESVRGRVFQDARPDAVFMDDFETNKTKRSVAITKAIVEHLDELFGGLAPNASVIFLCNYISDSGVVQYVLDKAKGNPRFLVRRVDAEREGKPSWEGKYAMSDLEAEARNTERPKEAPIVSLEAKRRDLGERVYATEMMNNPEAAGDLVFDRAKIDALITLAKEPIDKAGFKIWDAFNPAHRYAIGADTAKGVGRDSSASVTIDFTQMPNKVVGTYANNVIAPDIFAHELKRQGDFFGTCLIAVEINNQGYATANELKSIYDVGKIYRRAQTGKQLKALEKPSFEIGWETNAATKPDMIYQLKRAVEDGHLIIFDKGLLDEMRRYNQADLQDASADPDATRHFDKLIACAIAWAMRNHAVVSDAAEEPYEQPPYEPVSEYESPTREDN